MPLSRMWCTSVVISRAPEPPSGWPERDRAAVGVERLRRRRRVSASQASGTGRERLVDLEGADLVDATARTALSAFCVAGIGAVSMITGSAPARTAVCTRAIGVRPSSRGLLAGRDQQRGRAVGDLRGVAGGDHAALGLERRS